MTYSRPAEMPSQAAALPYDKVELFMRVCLKSQWNANAQEQRTRMIADGDVNWAVLLARTQSQRLSPLLYHILCNESGVPIETLQALRAAYDYTARYNLYLFGELRRLLARSKEAGVPILLLKGAALAHILYKDPAQRPLRDLDILVSREHVTRVEDIVKALGYSAQRAELQPGAALAYESQVTLFKTAPILSQIEIHWSLIDSPYYQENLATDWFWQTALPWRMGNVPALTLGPEAQTLYLCAHLLLHHGGNDLLWLNDIAQSIRFYSERMDWDELLRRAQALGLVVPTQKILFLVAQEWDAPIPAGVMVRVRELYVPPTEARVAGGLCSRKGSPASRFWNDVSSLHDWRKRFAFTWNNLFPSRAYMQRRYGISNPLLLPLYYPYRWWLGVYQAVSR